MSRRPKTFDERRQELIGSLNILQKAVLEFEKNGGIYILRILAGQLRALIVYESNSRSLNHPLLFELAKEKNFPLIVYMWDPSYTEKILQLNPTMHFGGDIISLNKDDKYVYETCLEIALEAYHVTINDKRMSLKEIIRDVAETEAIHYDPLRPEHLDQLDQIRIGGLSPEYRTIYTLSKIVIEVGFNFIHITR